METWLLGCLFAFGIITGVVYLFNGISDDPYEYDDERDTEGHL